MSNIRNERKQRIVDYMKTDAYKPLLRKELVSVIDVPSEDMEEFKNILQELEQEGRIFKTNRNRYGIPERMNLVTGTLQGSEKGFGFVIPDDKDLGDIFVPAQQLNGAMHKDRVITRINKKGLGERNAEGEIIKIVERSNSKIVGTFESSRHFGFIVPDDTRIPGDIFIPKNEINGAKDGQKVVAEILLWPEKRRNAEGRITEILGHSSQPGVDIVSIIRAHSLEEEFDQRVIKEAENINTSVTADMTKGRKDLRNLRMITIDGEDAKDLDDAVSIQKMDNGNYQLGVHIADVTNYVTEGSELDKEALKRGTSVYLVDRVIPMLPKKLSNGICSLNPNVDRLALTVIMEINNSGKVKRSDIYESVINIDERMTYKDVYTILEENDHQLSKRYSHLIDMLGTMKELAVLLRKKRMSRGAIDFDFEESKIILDDKGRPIDVTRYNITIANKIIEEFMLACNETVAERFYWQETPFVYRVHDDPEPEKIKAFSEFVYNLGYTLKGVNSIHPGAMQELVEKVKGTREELIINTVMLRSLQKAVYSHENDGHFGLAAKFYCHFTSPIRRYPDLIIHRIIKEYLANKIDEKRQEELKEKLPEIAKSCSEREQTAQEAEREVDDLKKAEYMRNHIGKEYEGIISNVTSFGMFVELDNTIEGLIHISDMEDDYYIYNEKNYSLMGERTSKTYKIGQTVTIKVARADIATRKIDFVFA